MAYWLVIAFIIFVLVVMLFRPAQQLEVISTGLLAIGIICTVPIMSRWKNCYRGKSTIAKYALNLFPAQAGKSFQEYDHDRHSQPTAIDGYRWLKNDIIRGVYQPDENCV